MRHALCLSLLLFAAADASAFTWPEKTVDSVHPEASGIALYDLDDDGDLDIVAGDKIAQGGLLAWYENHPQPMGQNGRGANRAQKRKCAAEHPQGRATIQRPASAHRQPATATDRTPLSLTAASRV